MKNCFAQRNEECGLLFFVKEKVTRIFHFIIFLSSLSSEVVESDHVVFHSEGV